MGQYARPGGGEAAEKHRELTERLIFDTKRYPLMEQTTSEGVFCENRDSRFGRKGILFGEALGEVCFLGTSRQKSAATANPLCAFSTKENAVFLRTIHNFLRTPDFSFEIFSL
ncbi:MAG: hypothetical protein LUD78_05010 [Clostridiales bacterium]|nr:hypothetical protein [Clostridiales bacterium]